MSNFITEIFQQVTQGHRIFVDEWAGVYNSHPHPPPSHTQAHTQTIPTAASKMCVFTFFSLIIMDQWTERHDNGWTKPSVYRIACPQLTRGDNSGKIKNETTYLANFCWTEDINFKKSMTVWKLCERSFKWDIAGHSSFIRLEMAQEWIKTLPYSVLQFNWIKRFWKEVVHFDEL